MMPWLSLRLNSNITIAGEMFHDQSLLKRGVCFVTDLINKDTGQWCTWKEFDTKYPQCLTILKFNSLNFLALSWGHFNTDNAIVTNIRLKHVKIIDNNRCSFCNTVPETLAHLFIECKHVVPLWQYINKICQNSSKWSTKEILMNNANPNKFRVEMYLYWL